VGLDLVGEGSALNEWVGTFQVGKAGVGSLVNGEEAVGGLEGRRSLLLQMVVSNSCN
jgi:hypothetical protein